MDNKWSEKLTWTLSSGELRGWSEFAIELELMCHNQFWLKKTPKVIGIFPKMIFFEKLWNLNCSWVLWRLVKNPKSNMNTRYKSKFWCPGDPFYSIIINTMSETFYTRHCEYNTSRDINFCTAGYSYSRDAK